jgi:hypothetical protein
VEWGPRKSRSFRDFVSFQGFARRKFSASVVTPLLGPARPAIGRDRNDLVSHSPASPTLSRARRMRPGASQSERCRHELLRDPRAESGRFNHPSTDSFFPKEFWLTDLRYAKVFLNTPLRQFAAEGVRRFILRPRVFPSAFFTGRGVNRRRVAAARDNRRRRARRERRRGRRGRGRGLPPGPSTNPA